MEKDKITRATLADASRAYTGRGVTTDVENRWDDTPTYTHTRRSTLWCHSSGMPGITSSDPIDGYHAVSAFFAPERPHTESRSISIPPLGRFKAVRD